MGKRLPRFVNEHAPPGTPGSEPNPPGHALSVSAGIGRAAKDFDWLAKNVPCRAACPAGTDVPAYLEAVAQGRYEDAYRINLRDNVFPGVLGRVCTRPCEPACRHGWAGLGESVAICYAKRASDERMRRGRPIVLDPLFPPSGRRVGVIGGGPAGLAAARDLALYGHQVTVYEREEEAGGLMVQGIPAFRLPRDVIRREVDQVQRTGVAVCCGVEIGRDINLTEVLDRHDALIIATGTHRPIIPDLPGVDLPDVWHGLPFLKKVNGGGDVTVGRRVLVIGGGFTAVDCARTARRLGAEHVTMCYRRSEAEMYITPGEVKEMQAEGVDFRTLTALLSLQGSDDGTVRANLAKVRLGPEDASGRKAPEVQAGTEEETNVDTVLLATGQERDLAPLGEDMASRLSAAEVAPPFDKIFMAGDVATGPASLVDAIGHARACARDVDRFLTGQDRLREAVLVEDVASTGRERAWDDTPRQLQPALPVEDRGREDEVEQGYDEDAAREEARRCYLCNLKFEIDNDLCIYCDRCLKVMPVEKCIVKAGALIWDDDGRITGYVASTSRKDYHLLYLDQNECIRCGACVDVCPVDCITLQKITPVTLP